MLESKVKNNFRLSGICTVLLFLLLTFSFSQEQFVYDAKGKRNPFIPLVTPDGRLIKVSAQEAKGALSLEGIIYDENGVSYCLINGAPSKIGDIVGESYQVLKIEQKKVIFIKDGELTEVLLKEGESEK